MLGQRLARVLGLTLLAVGCGDNDAGEAGRAVFGVGAECAIGSDDDAAGSYCVPEGTVYSPDTYVRALCSAESGNCDDRISGD